MSIKQTFVHATPSAVITYTDGSDNVYLHFVDRPTIINYPTMSSKGFKLAMRAIKHGYLKVTNPK